ncbi:hypothetical protein DEO72_LG10g2565 [Vigna unguiculata]|uniref:Uncharacterized protein n=1 Tax=Vigna unguiculata TaxID=3917 RepID=A0A4D6NEL1_VIGUN|nr:hypothetical protein DEO72_LG10g2565 [Vigna unguiculata]
MSSASDSVSLSSSGSGSERSGGDGSSRSNNGSGGRTVGVGRIPMETVAKLGEDPPEELAESNWPTKAGYEWVAEDVQTQHSLFRWSRLLKSWLNCIPILERNVSRDIVALERESNNMVVVNKSARDKSYGIDWEEKLESLSSSSQREGDEGQSFWSTEVPNLQDPLVEVHVHKGSKRKAKVPAKQGGKPEVELIELPKTIVRHDIDINLSESLVNYIDNMEPNAMVKAMLEFNSKALILGRKVGSLYQRELKEGNRSKVEELQGQVDKHAEEKAAWEKERE